jgi:hypothetical protein
MLPRKRSPPIAFTVERIISIAITKCVLKAHLTIATRMATLPARQLPKMVSGKKGRFSRLLQWATMAPQNAATVMLRQLHNHLDNNGNF